MKRSMKKEFNTDTYRFFRASVLERDKYMCAKCGANGVLEPFVDLRVHLLNNKEIDEYHISDMDNAVTLCSRCHDSMFQNSFHRLFGEENNTVEQYEKWLKMKYDKNKI